MHNGFIYHPFIPFLSFLALFIFSAVVRGYFRSEHYSNAAAGSIVMTLGIFYIAVLPKLPFTTDTLTYLFSLELFIIWFFIVYSIVSCYWNHGNFKVVIPHISNTYAIGTWVAGSAVLAVISAQTFPEWRIVDAVMTVATIIIWLVYIPFVAVISFRMLFGRCHLPATGMMLLPTVSTQAIVILLHEKMSDYMSPVMYRTLILLGFFFYLVNLILILHYHFRFRSKRLILHWSHSNSIIHGALSITGVAIFLSKAWPASMCIGIWFAATCLLIVIETINLFRLARRIQVSHYSIKAIRYSLSQWSRLFTYGMYFALTSALVTANLINNFFSKIIIACGGDIIFMLLLIETVLFFTAKFNRLIK